MTYWLLAILLILMIFVLGEKNLEEKSIYAKCFIVTAMIIGLIEILPIIKGV